MQEFPKTILNDNITDIDGYPLYRRRKADNGGHTFKMRRSNSNQLENDNKWLFTVKSFRNLFCLNPFKTGVAKTLHFGIFSIYVELFIIC